MADFNAAIVKTLAREGGATITEIAGDAGGLTKYGISQRAYPTADIRNLTEQQARDIYKRDYWDRVCGDRINSQPVAEAIFDFAVNAGAVTASKLTQMAIGNTRPDGVMGANTVAQLNAAINRPEDFIASYTLLKITRYAAICNKDKTQTKFLLGWINRALGGA